MKMRAGGKFYSLPVACLAAAVTLLGAGASPAMDACEESGLRTVKVEIWASKRFKKDFPAIGKAFAEMGNTDVVLWVYPAENPSRAVAIGRCVPAYIAQHVLRETRERFGEPESLVNQGFLSPWWIGIGTSLFDENSQRRTAPGEVARLMDPSLDPREFQALYRKYSAQEKTVPGFGLELANPKLMKAR
ncbi:MAG: hypothetical protein HZA02_00045 [Nitrospinae bacterium]|nr:hypothetical protein [Nitrospinota bacterium]